MIEVPFWCVHVLVYLLIFTVGAFVGNQLTVKALNNLADKEGLEIKVKEFDE